MSGVNIPQALTSDELSALSKPSHTQTYLSYVDPAHLLTASCQIDASGGLLLPTGSFKYKNSSTDLVNFVQNFAPYSTIGSLSGPSANPQSLGHATVWIGTTLGGKEKGIYRLRGLAIIDGVQAFEINEYGSGDPGLVPQDVRMADIADNDYVTIRIEFALWSEVPRIYPNTNPPFAKDYNNANDFQIFNTHMPLIVNAGPHRSLFADGSGSAHLVPIGGTAYDIAGLVNPTDVRIICEIPSSWTITTGSLGGGNLQCTIPQGFYIYKVLAYYTIPVTTGSAQGDTYGGYNVCSWAIRCLWVHGPDYPPLVVSSVTQDDRDRVGRTATITTYDDQLGLIPDGSLVNLWKVPYYDGFTVPTASNFFTGWITTTDGRAEPGNRSGTAKIVGPSIMLQKLPAFSQALGVLTGVSGSIVNVPKNFQELYTSYMTPASIMYYMLLWHYPNMVMCFDFNSYSGGHTVDYFDALASGVQDPHTIRAININAGNVWGQLTEIAAWLLYNLGCDSSGALWFWPDPVLCSVDKRGSITLRDTLTESKVTSITYPTVNKQNAIKRFRLEAFSTYGQAKDTAYISQVPGGAFGQGEQDLVTQGLRTWNQAELDELAGHVFAQKNPKYTDATLDIEGNYDVIEPAQMYWLGLNIPSKYDPLGLGWVMRTVPVSVSLTQNEQGAVKVRVITRPETAGIAGVQISVPSPPVILNPPPPPPPPPNIFPPVTTCDPANFPTGWTISDGTLQAAHAGALSAQELRQNLHIGAGGGGANSWESSARIDLPPGVTLHDWGYDAWFHNPGVSGATVYFEGSSITLYDASNSVITQGGVSAGAGYDSWLHVGRGSFSDLTGVDHIVVTSTTHGYGGGDGTTNPLEVFVSGLFACWS